MIASKHFFTLQKYVEHKEKIESIKNRSCLQTLHEAMSVIKPSFSPSLKRPFLHQLIRFFSLSFIIVPSKLKIKNRNTSFAIISTYLRKEKLDNMHHTYGKSKNQLISIFLSLDHIMSSPLLSLFYKMLKNIRNTPFFLLDWSTLALLFIIRYDVDHNMIISVEERASESDICSR